MFSRHRAVMLLIDVQGRLADAMVGRDALFASFKVLIKGLKIMGVPILWVEQIPSKLGPTRQEIRSLLDETQRPVEKDCFSCCRDTGFMEAFVRTGRDQVILTGIESHICVFQTGAELIRAGYPVQVVTDCVSSRTTENRDIGIQRLTQEGARVTSVEMILFELMGRARGDRFRQVVRLVK